MSKNVTAFCCCRLNIILDGICCTASMKKTIWRLTQNNTATARTTNWEKKRTKKSHSMFHYNNYLKMPQKHIIMLFKSDEQLRMWAMNCDVGCHSTFNIHVLKLYLVWKPLYELTQRNRCHHTIFLIVQWMRISTFFIMFYTGTKSKVFTSSSSLNLLVSLQLRHHY